MARSRIGWSAEGLLQEYGDFIGHLSDEFIALFTRIFGNHKKIRHGHKLQRFRGDLLLFISTEGRGGNVQAAARWNSYISGEIAEVLLPCRHREMMRPDMLPKICDSISTWLERAN